MYIMRVLILSAFVAAMAWLPVYAFETYVQPQLEALQYSYAHADETVHKLFAQQR